jgi:predicted DNA-binding transcriptional regulator AlpA
MRSCGSDHLMIAIFASKIYFRGAGVIAFLERTMRYNDSDTETVPSVGYLVTQNPSGFSGRKGGVIRMDELMTILQISKPTIYRRMDPKHSSYDPRFPKRIRLGFCKGDRGAVGWHLRDVEEYLHQL